MLRLGDENLEFELPRCEEDAVDVSLSESLDETVLEFAGPAASLANTSAAA